MAAVASLLFSVATAGRLLRPPDVMPFGSLVGAQDPYTVPESAAILLGQLTRRM